MNCFIYLENREHLRKVDAVISKKKENAKNLKCKFYLNKRKVKSRVLNASHADKQPTFLIIISFS
jgi:hypothetical protein